MLFVKANNGRLVEGFRFQRLAHDDLMGRLGKKKMKALIPQIIQVIYITGLLVLCSSTLALSRTSFDMSKFFSFVTSLALLIEPIQVIFFLSLFFSPILVLVDPIHNAQFFATVEFIIW